MAITAVLRHGGEGHIEIAARKTIASSFTVLALPAITQQYQQFMVRQAVRMAAFAGLLAFVVCLACGGTPASVEPPPVAESVVDSRDTTGESDAESEGGSWLAQDGKSAAASRWTGALDPDGGNDAPLGTFAAVVAALFPFAPPKLLAARTPCPGSHARIALLLISSVPTRGPTLLS